MSPTFHRPSLFWATVAIAVSSCLFVACGGGDDDDFFGGGSTEVREIELDDDVVPATDGSVMRVDFSFDQNEVFFDDENVVVVIKLPPELRYRNNSAEIDGPAGDDENVDPQILGCDSGETYLEFNMDRFDLDDASSPGEGAEAQLKLTVDGVRRAENVVIEARADEGRVPFGCNQSFIPDEQEIVSVR